WDEALGRRVGDGDAPVTARPATLADSSLLLRWRNDPETRAVSRSTDRVSWEGHTGWYARAVEAPERELYVIERGGAPVGTVRFDALEGPEGEVSITLAPEARGLGRSRPVLAAGHSVHGARHPGAGVVADDLPPRGPGPRALPTGPRGRRVRPRSASPRGGRHRRDPARQRPVPATVHRGRLRARAGPRRRRLRGVRQTRSQLSGVPRLTSW